MTITIQSTAWQQKLEINSQDLVYLFLGETNNNTRFINILFGSDIFTGTVI